MSKELKWVDKIITGINKPDVSGFAIVENGIVISEPIPKEFNGIIAELLQKAEAGEKAVEAMNKFRKTHNNWFIDYPKVIQKDGFSNDLLKMFNQAKEGTPDKSKDTAIGDDWKSGSCRGKK
jgi:hypothetical protein